MEQFVWVLVGFFLAICWDKYKDWNDYKYSLNLVKDEIEETLRSLEYKHQNMPDKLKQVLDIVHQGGVENVDFKDITTLPKFELMNPYKISAWQNFVAKGYLTKLHPNDSIVLKDAYDTLIGNDFIKGLSPTLVSFTSSPIFNEDEKAYFNKLIRIAPIFPVIFALPKLKTALKSLETLTIIKRINKFFYFMFH